MEKKLNLTFNQSKETKGTHRFDQPLVGGKRPEVGSIYVTKDALQAAGIDPAKGLDVVITERS